MTTKARCPKAETNIVCNMEPAIHYRALGGQKTLGKKFWLRHEKYGLKMKANTKPYLITHSLFFCQQKAGLIIIVL